MAEREAASMATKAATSANEAMSVTESEATLHAKTVAMIIKNRGVSESEAAEMIEQLCDDYEAEERAYIDRKIQRDSSSSVTGRRGLSEREGDMIADSVIRAAEAKRVTKSEAVAKVSKFATTFSSSVVKQPLIKFIAATGINTTNAEIQPLREALAKIDGVNGMTGSAAKSLLSNAMTIIEAKRVTGIEAAFMFLKAATLIAKAAGEINSKDASMPAVAVTSIVEITGMTESEVTSIYANIAANRSEGARFAHDPDLETLNTQMRLMAKVKRCATESKRPNISIFHEVAASIAEAKGVSKTEAAAMLTKSMSSPTIEAAIENSELTMSEAMSIAAKDAMSMSPTDVNCPGQVSFLDRIPAFLDATGIHETEDVRMFCKAMTMVAEVNGMTYTVATSLLFKVMAFIIEAECENGIEALSMLSKAVTLIAKAADVSCDDATMLAEAVTSVAEVTGLTDGEVASIFAKIAANRSEGAMLAHDPDLENFNSHMRSFSIMPNSQMREIAEVGSVGTAFADPQSDQLRKAKRRKEKKERRKAEKEKSWKTEGDVEKYDFEKVLKDLCDDVEDTNIGKKAGKKTLSGNNNSVMKDKNKRDAMCNLKARKKKKKSNNKQGVGESERDEDGSKGKADGAMTISSTNNGPSTSEREDVSISKLDVEEANATTPGSMSGDKAQNNREVDVELAESQEDDEQSDAGSISHSSADLDPRTKSPSCVEPSALTVGQITIHPDKELGQGGFGTVCEGKFGGRRVAVKRVPNFLANVDREVQLHMKCDSHENVLRYIHVEEDKMRGLTYLVVELCQGTLVDYVEGKLHVEGKQPKDLLKDATKGVVHLHKLGIVHRDIKPSNILISLPESGVVKAVIGDFGVSKKLEDGHQSFSVSITGTQRWMAPEIISGDSRVTILVDVYALGWVFFYILTGILPFNGKSNFELLMSIKNGENNLGHQINDETAKFLIERMTSLDAKHRPPTKAVLEHPFFWDNKKELNFIEVISDHLPAKPQVWTNLKRSRKVLFGSLNAGWGDVATAWPKFAPVINHLGNPQQIVAKYDFNSARDLLRAIRNLSHHLAEQPIEIQAVFGGSAPKTLVSDVFLKIFPHLLVGTWSLVSKEVGHEPGFREFYHEWWVKNA